MISVWMSNGVGDCHLPLTGFSSVTVTRSRGQGRDQATDQPDRDRARVILRVQVSRRAGTGTPHPRARRVDHRVQLQTSRVGVLGPEQQVLSGLVAL